MAFRADESAQNGRESAIRYLVTKNLPPADRSSSEEKLHGIIDELGPVVETYPSWHPLVSSGRIDHSNPATRPNDRCGYAGLDHTFFFRNGFVSCPYTDGSSIVNSVSKLKAHRIASISAEILDFPLYASGTTAVLVKCNWHVEMEPDGMVPKRIAVPLLLEMEVPAWHNSNVAETWETMRPYFLGSPRGSRSSLFVTQETGQVLKNLWNMLIHSGMYGPIYV
jgi:hypothetical protein